MPIEHEAKVLEIDPAAVEQRILDRGGQKLGERLMRRYVYDIIPGDQSKWIRLRQTGNETTLTVKEITSDAIDGTFEVEVKVGDFETTAELLRALGFTPKSYQETRRTSFSLDGAALEIDAWPRIPPLPGDRSRLQRGCHPMRGGARLRRARAHRGEHHQDLLTLRHRSQHHPRTALLTMGTSHSRTPLEDERLQREAAAFWSAMAAIDPDEYRSSLVEDEVDL